MLTFDQKFARLLLEICRYTYAGSFDTPSDRKDRQEALDRINEAAVPSTVALLNDGRVPSTSVACVVACPDRNIVSYMGTKTEFSNVENSVESIADWFQNFEAVPVPFRFTAEELGRDHPDKDNLGGHVHQGFLEQLRLIQAQVVAKLMEHGGTGRPLYVTGHSQGGAEAVLATRAFLAGGFPVAGTFTFAAPRPGDRDFAGSIPATLPFHRIEFGNDIVPHVPPMALSEETRAVLRALATNPLLSHDVKKVLQRLATGMGAFVGVGRLCYGSPETKALRVDIDAEQEATMFVGRLMRLMRDPVHWGEHHHLAGTSAEVRAGVKGNYTALVSEYPIVS